MTKKLPKSKAKTAYGLLSEICHLVTAEPKRLAMRTWISRSTGKTKHEEYEYPACGTVGCIAGWTTTLRGRRLSSESSVERVAAKILGLDETERRKLFAPEHLIEHHFGEPDPATEAQTPEHAAATVEHIRKFQRRYAAQLKATRI